MMVAFELNAGINADNVFLVSFSELQGRLDPLFYNTVHSFSLVKTTYPVKKLSEVIYMQRGRFGHRPRNEPKFYNGKYPFIQTGDVVKASQTNEPITYTQTLNELGLKTSRLFDKKVLVITIAANIGYTAILDYPACFPDSLIGITPKSDELTLNYLNIYFKFLKPYLEDIAPQSAQKNINYQQLSPVPIVVPPLAIQQKICDLFDQAHNQKQQKEQQALALLDSIDGYLLNELGITLPEQDNRLEKRMFTVPLSEIRGGRFDPKLYDSITKGIRSAVLQATFKTKPLNELITHSSAGDWGMDATNEDNGDYQNCLVIRATEFDNQYNLRLENSRVKYRLINRKKLNLMDIRVNDLLIEKSGGSIDQPVGRIALLTDKMIRENQLGYSNFIHKIRVDDTRVSPTYLFFYLKLMHNIKLTDSMQSQTNGIRNLIMNNYFNQNIVIPLMGKQTEIATHITKILAQAKQLQVEATLLLATAKADIERMILGKSS